MKNNYYDNDDLGKNANFDKNVFSLRQMIQKGWNLQNLEFQKLNARWFPLNNYLLPNNNNIANSKKNTKQNFDISDWFLSDFYWTNQDNLFSKIMLQNKSEESNTIYLSKTLKLGNLIKKTHQQSLIYNANIINELLDTTYKCIVKLIQLPSNSHTQPFISKGNKNIEYYWHPAYIEVLINYILYNKSFYGHYCITDDKKIFDISEKSYMVIIIKHYNNDMVTQFVTNIKNYEIEFNSWKLLFSKRYAKMLSLTTNKSKNIENIQVFDKSKINYTDLKNIHQRVDYKSIYKQQQQNEIIIMNNNNSNNWFQKFQNFFLKNSSFITTKEKEEEETKDLSEYISDFLAQLVFCILHKFELKYNFIHGDLKLDNILYEPTDKKYFYVKLINGKQEKEEILKIPTNGWKLKLIDFAWSSLTLQHQKHNKNKFRLLINLDKIKNAIEKKYINNYNVTLLKKYILKKSNFNHVLLSIYYKLHNVNILPMINVENTYMNIGQITNMFLRMLNIINPSFSHYHWQLPILQKHYEMNKNLQLKKRIYMWNNLLNLLTLLACSNQGFIINTIENWDLFFYNFINNNMTYNRKFIYNIDKDDENNSSTKYNIWKLFKSLYNNNDVDVKLDNFFYYYIKSKKN